MPSHTSASYSPCDAHTPLCISCSAPWPVTRYCPLRLAATTAHGKLTADIYCPNEAGYQYPHYHAYCLSCRLAWLVACPSTEVVIRALARDAVHRPSLRGQASTRSHSQGRNFQKAGAK